MTNPPVARLPPLVISPDNPASVPALRQLVDRAVIALLAGPFADQPPDTALTDEQKAEAYSFALAHLDADTDAVDAFSGVVGQAADDGRRYLETYTLPMKMKRLLYAENHT